MPPGEFWKKYDAGEFGKPVTNINDPDFQRWVALVERMPVDKQLEAVAKKLQVLNPGFDGRVTPKIENGAVTGLTINTDNVTDLSPVRALPWLTALYCWPLSANGQVVRPIAAGWPAPQKLLCPFTQVSTCRRWPACQ